MKPTIKIDDFAKIEIRVGKVVAAVAPDWSEKLIQEAVDFGPEIGIKTVFSGVRKWIDPTTMIGKKYLFVINLEEKKMGDSFSQGMILGTDVDEKAFLFEVDPSVPEGSLVH